MKFEIGEEFGTARKNLPPAKIVLIALAMVVVGAIILELVQRPTSATTGAIGDVSVAEITGRNSVLVAINVSIQNNGAKPYWIHTIEAELDTASGNHTDDAASAVDFERYFQGYPALKEHALAPLTPETKLMPGAKTSGTIIVSFPVAADGFNGRKALKVKITPYDQPVPLVLSK
jgi:hypothetical protein